MKSLALWYVFLPLVLVASACSRKTESSSHIVIQLPPAPAALSKVTSELAIIGVDNGSAPLGTTPALPTAPVTTPSFCYYVNVLGSGITETAANCAPSTGTGSGFVAPASTISMTVNKGSGRTVELYGYIPRFGEICGQLGKSLSAVPVNRLFQLGRKTGIDMSANDVDVVMTVDFTGIAQHYGVQVGLPTTCYASLTPIGTPIGKTNPGGLGISSASGVATNSTTGYKMIGYVGRALPREKFQSSTGYQFLTK